ncbi:MAG: 30S ribosomal protein S16 [Waddliaceae bacterium]|jgi:small subunit ribosomal protein S16|nr:30S ribosomal protein S16 [Waddliaceae bacterium]MBT3579185.1 30S ribosomal protein S16 [Waddliaceae bacterium]MBT4444755.1 30S ribosomal protein S16 [Waddliaceae bacterium]MBT6928885.1 30S ribosomal protein S16 [Waddliaceae bacterium]MBT7264133.1 30S ribosomal protein S16 [Waddliaceae bacterium]
MALKIRMRRQGRRNRPFYRIVVANSESPRDGRHVEVIGWYNPIEKEDDKILSIDVERVKHWLEAGAQPTEKVEHLIAKVAPEVIKERKQKAVARRETLRAKRKARKSKTTA